MKKKMLLILCIFALTTGTQHGLSDQAIAGTQTDAAERKIILLWPNGAPGAVGNDDADRPTLDVYMPPAAKATGTAVVICPGGGYIQLDMDHEGGEMAQWFNSFGVAAFVLKYRLAPRYHYPAMFQDAQRALRYVRAHADDFGVAADRIGIIGFSAGGHLASTAATHFEPAIRARPIRLNASAPDRIS